MGRSAPGGLDPSPLVTRVFAHRGAHRDARENTLAAFRAAVALGVDGVEFDVRKSADGVLVVHHDPAIGGRPVSRTPHDELPAWVPTFDQALAATRGVVANVEIKNTPDPGEAADDETGALVLAVLEAIERAALVTRPVVSCFDRATCARVRAARAPVEAAWLVEDLALEDALAQAHALGLDALNPHVALVDASGVARARELGLDLYVWTVNRDEDLAAMAALGVEAVITDEPARALAACGRRGPGRS
jgi:glycerophosphoryl diester phosphodiesterase